MNTTNRVESAIARIFEICDYVAMTGETIRTEKEAQEAARVWLGVKANTKLTGDSPVQR